MARSPEAHRRRGIIQSLYLLVFQRSHSRFNSRYVYCHSVVIFPLKFSLGNKKLWRSREWNSAIGRLYIVARGSIALNKFALRDRTTIRYPAILFTIKKRSSLQIKLPAGLRFFSETPPPSSFSRSRRKKKSTLISSRCYINYNYVFYLLVEWISENVQIVIYL